MAPVPLVETAPAKVNLTLRVLGRRSDGYHEIESLVAFADCADVVQLTPGGALALSVHGPYAAAAGDGADNLVLKAVRSLVECVAGLELGAFDLDKRLPVAAGLGGGSADAAAALRLLARANGVAADDRRLYTAARATGADVPVCLDPRLRVMRGIGDILSLPLDLPALPAVLVNPGVALATRAVFSEWRPSSAPLPPPPAPELALATPEHGGGRDEVLRWLASCPNDLEPAAIVLAPVIGEVLVALRGLPGCRVARMSGSGATCFALFATAAEAIAAAKILTGRYSHWWVRATRLGSAADAAEAAAQ